MVYIFNNDLEIFDYCFKPSLENLKNKKNSLLIKIVNNSSRILDTIELITKDINDVSSFHSFEYEYCFYRFDSDNKAIYDEIQFLYAEIFRKGFKEISDEINSKQQFYYMYKSELKRVKEHPEDFSFSKKDLDGYKKSLEDYIKIVDSIKPEHSTVLYKSFVLRLLNEFKSSIMCLLIRFYSYIQEQSSSNSHYLNLINNCSYADLKDSVSSIVKIPRSSRYTYYKDKRGKLKSSDEIKKRNNLEKEYIYVYEIESLGDLLEICYAEFEAANLSNKIFKCKKCNNYYIKNGRQEYCDKCRNLSYDYKTDNPIIKYSRTVARRRGSLKASYPEFFDTILPGLQKDYEDTPEQFQEFKSKLDKLYDEHIRRSTTFRKRKDSDK